MKSKGKPHQPTGVKAGGFLAPWRLRELTARNADLNGRTHWKPRRAWRRGSGPCIVFSGGALKEGWGRQDNAPCQPVFRRFRSVISLGAQFGAGSRMIRRRGYDVLAHGETAVEQPEMSKPELRHQPDRCVSSGRHLRRKNPPRRQTGRLGGPAGGEGRAIHQSQDR
jgi:hypothetical protein